MATRMRIRIAALMVLAMIAPTCVRARAQDAQTTIDTLLRNEKDATAKRGRYMYLSVEKSDRTGGHTWTERMAETQWGKIKYLLEEDGRPLTGDRLTAEKARLAQEAADPEGFKRAEIAHADDEAHAREMLRLLPSAFLFDPPVLQGDTIRMPFRPNPDYSPQGLEERVMHGMSGNVLIDAKTMRLRGIDAHVPQDINFGFGLVSIKAGSSVDTFRIPVEGIDWKTETVHSAIMGRALFLKTIARNQESKHSEFRKIPNDISVADAVKMVEGAGAAEHTSLQ